jgi:hypothetical protein
VVVYARPLSDQVKAKLVEVVTIATGLICSRRRNPVSVQHFFKRPLEDGGFSLEVTLNMRLKYAIVLSDAPLFGHSACFVGKRPI